ncbi:MAG TPA: glycoside hydrolase family 3 N-terminal domain-containing protein, partial [Thermoanaerobaculia bacterium]|nr:glycoside hydrolase family 3 N-terminal domain-containing protein [Thermoanaerobaculia bacterium]
MKGGALLFVGFEGQRLGAGERRILRRLQPGGVVLLPRNIGEEPELHALVAELRALCPETILALDAEGGRVDRLRNIVGPAPAAADLARHPPGLARRAGRWIGAALRAFAFDLDFAPVVDLDHGRQNNALDRRCLGKTPLQVVTKAKRFIEGLEAAGVGACLKHWPGLGAAGEDTHLEPSRIDLSRADLERDAEPFRRLAARAGAVMVGHAIYPALDPEQRPATLSPALVAETREAVLPFNGVFFSDDLEMGALASFGDLAERGEAALRAGCDGLLFCRQLEATPEIAARLARPRLA